MDEKVLVSIIVPVYNVKRYVSKCLDSLVNQTYANVEIILVDDGSTDGSGEICDEYEKKYANILVIHQKNKGLSGARNTGIAVAKGEYVTFVDSDDFVTLDFIEYLFGMIKSYKADMSICSSYKFFVGSERKNEKEKDAKIKIFNAQNALENMLYRKDITAYACGKMYSLRLFETIRFPEGQLFEDLNTIYKVIARCDRICWSSAEKYYYLQRENSIVNSGFNIKKMSVIEAGLEIKKFVTERYPDIEKAAISKIFVSAIDLYRRLPQSKEFINEKEYLDKIIRGYRRVVLKDRGNKLLTRVIALVACINIKILKLMCLGYTVLTEKFHIQFKKPV